MRPGTVHFVLTVENSITDGRHGYAASTMAESAYAIIHTFVLDPFITNTTHYATQKLWRRIFKFWMISFQSEYPGIFWFLSVFLPVSLTCLLVSESCRAHVPDPGTWQGVCDILAVINIIQLSGVLDCRTYTEGLPLEERSEPYAARRVCQDFADFFSSSYGVKRDGKLLLAREDLFEVSTTQVLPLPMLRNLSTRPRLQMAVALTFYKKRAHKFVKTPCTPLALQKEIKAVLGAISPELTTQYSSMVAEGETEKAFGMVPWNDGGKYEVVKHGSMSFHHYSTSHL